MPTLCKDSQAGTRSKGINPVTPSVKTETNTLVARFMYSSLPEMISCPYVDLTIIDAIVLHNMSDRQATTLYEIRITYPSGVRIYPGCLGGSRARLGPALRGEDAETYVDGIQKLD